MNKHLSEEAQREAAESKLRKTIVIETCVAGGLILIGLMPIALFHLDLWNLYTLVQIERDEVAAYATAIYISILLSFKILKDDMIDKAHSKAEDAMFRTREMRYRSDGDMGSHGLSENEVAVDEFRSNAHRSVLRMVRYFVVFITYIFISCSYLYIHKSVI